jgi:hypothetical protein
MIRFSRIFRLARFSLCVSSLYTLTRRRCADLKENNWFYWSLMSTRALEPVLNLQHFPLRCSSGPPALLIPLRTTKQANSLDVNVAQGKHGYSRRKRKRCEEKQHRPIAIPEW